jgi:hypothetical protein
MAMENPAPKKPLDPGKSYHTLMSLFVAAAAIGFILLAASINSYTTQMLEEIKGLRQDISDLRDRDLMSKKARMDAANGEATRPADGEPGAQPTPTENPAE